MNRLFTRFLFVCVLALTALMPQASSAQAFTNSLEDGILTYWFRPGETAPTRPTAIYVALSSTDPGEDCSGITEPDFTGYARQAVTFSAPQNGTGTSREVANTGAVEFGDPDADGSVGYFALFTASTSGTCLVQEALDATVNYQAAVNDPLSFPVGSLKVSAD